MKFSIIVPVYNVSFYIEKCLTSIFDSSYSNYEVIIINDGSTDDSEEKVKRLIKDKSNVKYIKQSNKGLSSARNTGVKHAKGEYIVFLDSDDYIDKDLLKKIKESIINKPDVVRYQVREVYGDRDDIDYFEKEFNNLDGVLAFHKICKYHFVENAWCYAIKRDYYNKNKFSFKEGTYHEDFGLIPLVIMKADIVNSISFVGYNYLQRQGSIMNNEDYEKTKKKVNDFYLHYKYLISEIDKTNLDSKAFKSFVANSMIIKISELEKLDYKFYLKKLKKDEVFKNLLTNTMGRRIKKMMLIINPRFYYRNRLR